MREEWGWSTMARNSPASQCNLKDAESEKDTGTAMFCKPNVEKRGPHCYIICWSDVNFSIRHPYWLEV
jgi:hypothetical protein